MTGQYGQGRAFQALAMGQGYLPAALVLGASTNVTVTLSSDMMSTDYEVEMSAPPNMTLALVSKTRTSVTVQVTAGLALPLGMPFYVLAVN